jgi:predicted N-formylglutamate amidohydrolase
MRGFVVSCEHASNAVPEGIELGVGPDVLDSHTAWDPGAAEIARLVADGLGTTAFLGTATRLYVDLNRSEQGPAVIPIVAFGVAIPGNATLDVADREARLAHHRAYRNAVTEAVRQTLDQHGRCVHLSIHSFTPELHGAVRDFDCGVLYDPDSPADRVAADALFDALTAAGFATRRNEPYGGTGDGFTTTLRNTFGRDRYAGIEVETSHRVTDAAGGIERVARAVLRLG